MKMSIRYFVFTWPDGTTKEGPGVTPEDAFVKLGFNKSTMNAIDNYQEEKLSAEDQARYELLSTF